MGLGGVLTAIYLAPFVAVTGITVLVGRGIKGVQNIELGTEEVLKLVLIGFLCVWFVVALTLAGVWSSL